MTGGKVLIVGPAWVGDMVMAQSLYKLLQNRDPALQIHVVAPAWSRPLLARMREVSRAMELAVGHGEAGIGARWRLGRSLRGEGYRQAIVLPRSFKAALVPYFAGARTRTGFRGEWRYGLLNDIRPYDLGRLDQTVKRYIALGMGRGDDELPSPPPPSLSTDADNLRATARRLGLELSTDAVAIVPGAEHGPAKRWPAARYGELAGRLASAGAQVWILGSSRERELCDAVSAAASHTNVVNLCGKTGLTDAVDLLGAARVAVTNDSGLMHIAAAVDTHVIGIYGPSSPGFTPPLTSRADIFYKGLDCSPCFRSECPLGHFRCMLEISVDAVLGAALTALATAPRLDMGAGSNTRGPVADSRDG